MYVRRPEAEERLISIAYWYPILQKLASHSKIPQPVPVRREDGKLTFREVQPEFIFRVPRTIMVNYPEGLAIYKLFDGNTPPAWDYFKKAMALAATEIGYPLFMKSENTSDKHRWKSTCYVENEEQLFKNLTNLIETCGMADLPMDFWALREMIPTTPVVTAFNDMPIAAERRVFIREDKVVCHHPYWPSEAFENQNVDEATLEQLQQISDEDKALVEKMACAVGSRIGGEWSVDFLKDSDGNWWCIDMAIAHASYHWPGCTALQS